MTDNIYRRPNANSNISVEGLEIDMLLAGDVNAKVSKPKWSSAYEISRQKAMQSSSYIEDKGMEIPKPSLKMIIGILLLIFAGSVMFITGSVLYWASVPGQKHTGFDVMIIGGVSKYIISLIAYILQKINFSQFFFRVVLSADTGWLWWPFAFWGLDGMERLWISFVNG